MIGQVNDFLMACDQELTAEEMCKIVGSKLRPLKEAKDPFAHLGPTSDFNGMDVTQNQTCEAILLKLCRWDNEDTRLGNRIEVK